MSIFTTTYGVVDSFFISNFAGKDAFAALMLVLPLISMMTAVGFMLGGVWLVILTAELLSFITSLILVLINRRKYGYL